MKKNLIIMLFLIISTLLFASASYHEEAIKLMKKCETEVQMIEIPTKNFGGKEDLKTFEDGLKIIKMGKVYVAQAKYQEAIKKFNEYLELQYNLYKSLGEKYIKRTEKLIDEIGLDLADYVSDDEILKNFTSASQHLANARAYMTKKQYDYVLNPCRRAKNYLIIIYKMVGKKTPDEYLVDLADYENKIYSK